LVTPKWTKSFKVEKIYRITSVNNSLWKDQSKPSIFNSSLAEEVQSAHWWGYEVWINMNENPWDFSLIRKSWNLWDEQ
jgi:hypothetical protein